MVTAMELTRVVFSADKCVSYCSAKGLMLREKETYSVGLFCQSHLTAPSIVYWHADMVIDGNCLFDFLVCFCLWRSHVQIEYSSSCFLKMR